MYIHVYSYCQQSHLWKAILSANLESAPSKNHVRPCPHLEKQNKSCYGQVRYLADVVVVEIRNFGGRSRSKKKVKLSNFNQKLANQTALLRSVILHLLSVNINLVFIYRLACPQLTRLYCSDDRTAAGKFSTVI